MEEAAVRMARLFKTALIMSVDLLDGLYGSRDLMQENRQLEMVLDELTALDTYDIRQMSRLEDTLSRYASRIMSLYARHPESIRLDSTYHRACSIRDICTTCINGLLEAGHTEGRDRVS